MTVTIYTVNKTSYAYVNGTEASAKRWWVAFVKALWKHRKK